MNDINFAIKHFCNFHAFFNCVATVREFSTTDSRFDWIVITNCFSHFFNNQKWETHTVFKASTPFISSFVHCWRDELVWQPTVSHMYQNHIDTSRFRVCCCLTEFFCCFNYLFFCHCLNWHTLRVDFIIWTHCTFCICTNLCSCICISSTMLQFHNSICIVAMH